MTRWRLLVGGIVQGVGFRPFVYRLARRLALAGTVANTPAGVVLEIEGPVADLTTFVEALEREAPPAALIEQLERQEIAVCGQTDFVIAPSSDSGAPAAGVVPDLALCPDCLGEMLDPADRRYLYPFINCTNCGPRYTIIEQIPYDRPHTSMRAFTMCPACQAEYDDPASRRFHAQPNACPLCGPQISLEPVESPPANLDKNGDRSIFSPGAEAGSCAREEEAQRNAGVTEKNKSVPIFEAGAALNAARRLLKAGGILAVKGIGGFHLAVNAADQSAVLRLRQRKGRAAKPLALMVRDLTTARRLVHLQAEEEKLLNSPARPIVLAGRREIFPTPGGETGTARTPQAAVPGDHMLRAETDDRLPAVAPAVAPGQLRLGLMLPYAPLHHLLLDADLPLLVMTSANRSQEPICIGNEEARRRLAGIADAFLFHDREIVRGNDDSVVMVAAGDHRAPHLAAISPAHVAGYAAPARLPQPEAPRGRLLQGDHRRLVVGHRSANEIVADLPAVPVFLRRGRGYAPGILPLAGAGPARLAVGAELKNTVCLAAGGRAILSQHLGDLQNLESYRVFERTIADLSRIFAIEPELVVHDLHPDYLAGKWAQQWAAERGLPVLAVQHHHAHFAACLAENRHEGPALGLILDGTGYGPDHTIWGGEILLGDGAVYPVYPGYYRYGQLEYMPLPGGDLAVRQPWRTALGYLHRAFAGAVPDLPFLAAAEVAARRETVTAMVVQNLNCPQTSSCGRLFDAVAAMAGGRGEISYEAQAALELMQAGGGMAPPAFAYRLERHDGRLIILVTPLIREVAAAVAAGASLAEISRRFHYTLVKMFTEALTVAAGETGLTTVALSGGVMQNEVLLRGLRQSLARAGLTVLLPRRLPPNDGCIAFGQAVIAGNCPAAPRLAAIRSA